MGDEYEYVPRRGDMVIFDRDPPGCGQHKVFQVTSHDIQAGTTTFARLPSPLSAHEMAELAPRKLDVISPSELEPDWAGAGRWLAGNGAGARTKICQLAPLDGLVRMLPADEQAALALAQRAADQSGEPVILARTGTGELIIASRGTLQAAGEGLGAQALLVVQPGVLGGSSAVQARELLSSDQAHEVVAGALASVSESHSSVASAAAVLQAIAALLPAAEDQAWITVPGWQYRAELTPEYRNAHPGG
jgi:hypothetical protein